MIFLAVVFQFKINNINTQYYSTCGCFTIRFPNSVKRPGVYNAWVEFVSKVRPGKFVPAKSSRIYPEHFNADMFQKLNSNTVMLKADAVPTVIKDNCQVCVASYSFN